MVDPDVPATEPIPVIDPAAAAEFLARLRAHSHRAGRASELLRADPR